MKKIKWIVWFCVGVWGCKSPEPAPEGASLPLQPALDTPLVQTQVAEVKTFDYTVQASGKIKAFREELVLAPRAGTLQCCPLKNGQTVDKNELLAAFETSDLELRRQRILVQQFSAQQEYESQLLGYANLLREKTAQEAEQVHKKLKAATGLLALELDLQELEQALGRSRLRAPFAGRLAQVKTQVGMAVQSGQELFRLYTNHQLYLEAQVLEVDLPQLKLGQKASVRSLALGGRSYPAQLTEIDPIVSEQGVVTVRLSIPAARDLLLGMNASAEIRVPQKKGIVLPQAAIVLRNNRPVVFTCDENGRANWNYVTTGTVNGDLVEVIEGIEIGDEVIISNNVQLGHQAPVKKTASK